MIPWLKVLRSGKDGEGWEGLGTVRKDIWRMDERMDSGIKQCMIIIINAQSLVEGEGILTEYMSAVRPVFKGHLTSHHACRFAI